MSARVGLSIKLGTIGGIIWGCFFTAYYSMLQSFKFAAYASTICFIVLIAFFLLWPIYIKACKDVLHERKEKEKENEE